MRKRLAALLYVFALVTPAWWPALGATSDTLDFSQQGYVHQAQSNGFTRITIPAPKPRTLFPVSVAMLGCFGIPVLRKRINRIGPRQGDGKPSYAPAVDSLRDDRPEQNGDFRRTYADPRGVITFY